LITTTSRPAVAERPRCATPVSHHRERAHDEHGLHRGQARTASHAERLAEADVVGEEEARALRLRRRGDRRDGLALVRPQG
jgi:hypothetical protein